MRPDHGGRLELKLLRASADSARYAVTIYTPQSVLTSEVNVVAASGELEFSVWLGGSPSDWLGTLTRSVLRGVWRTHSSDGDWPRRVTRWRPGPKV